MFNIYHDSAGFYYCINNKVNIDKNTVYHSEYLFDKYYNKIKYYYNKYRYSFYIKL